MNARICYAGTTATLALLIALVAGCGGGSSPGEPGGNANGGGSNPAERRVAVIDFGSSAETRGAVTAKGFSGEVNGVQLQSNGATMNWSAATRVLSGQVRVHNHTGAAMYHTEARVVDITPTGAWPNFTFKVQVSWYVASQPGYTPSPGSGDHRGYSSTDSTWNYGQIASAGESSYLGWAFTAPAEYSITDLGTLGGPESRACGINDSGQVVGYADRWELGSNYHAFIWDPTYTNPSIPASHMRDLGTLINGDNYNGPRSKAFGINAGGQVTGDSEFWFTTPYPNYASYSGTHAFVWDAAGGMRDIRQLYAVDPFGDFSNTCRASGINDSGMIAGTAYVNNGKYYAYVWDPANKGRLLGSFGGWSMGTGINNLGRVVGYGNLTLPSGALASQAFICDSPPTIRNLGTLPGGRYSRAAAINDAGYVVGDSTKTMDPNAPPLATLWAPNGATTELGTLGGTRSWATGLNDLVQVVGYCYSPDHAFVWDAAAGMRDLNSLIPTGSGWVLTQACGINHSGQIVGWGSIGGHTRAFLLTPVSR